MEKHRLKENVQATIYGGKPTVREMIKYISSPKEQLRVLEAKKLELLKLASRLDQEGGRGGVEAEAVEDLFDRVFDAAYALSMAEGADPEAVAKTRRRVEDYLRKTSPAQVYYIARLCSIPVTR